MLSLPKEVIEGLLIPFIGTSLGAACVYVMRGEIRPRVQKGLTGFASGIMVAASIWSLLLPAIDESAALGKFACMPAILGFWLGTLFLLALDRIIPHLHMHAKKAEGMEGLRASLSKNTMLVFAVTLHNIPEGMAVGVVLAGWLTGSTDITIGGALALSLGIAIQNFPEGAIISMPLASSGMNRHKACVAGVLSGIVEPIGGALTIFLAGAITPFMPYFLAFAAGAMFYVVVEELIPEMSAGEHSDVGVLTFAFGFTLMMLLDTVLG